MSPLWKGKNVKRTNKKLLIVNQKRPSPRCDYLYFAQSILFCHSRRFLLSKIKRIFIEGISLLISRMPRVEASMTVEAAVVLPLFLCFFLNLGCSIELIRLHGNLEFGLCDIGNRMAVYSYILTRPGEEKKIEDSPLWDELKDVAFSYTYIKNELVNYVGDTYLEESPVVNGVAGLQLWESEIFTEGDCFEIVVTYAVKPFSELVGFGSFRMANRYYGHLWNGYEIPGTEDTAEPVEMVFVTENGVVYHKDRNCSHLLLSVREVSLQEAYESRNTNGSKYTPCLRCDNDISKDRVYITTDGENIHYRRDCPGLHRTVYALSVNCAQKYKICSRCGGEA